MAAAKVAAEQSREPAREGGKRNVTGVWVVYRMVDELPLMISPHADELDARRFAMDGPDGCRVVFVRWDQLLAEALG